MAKQKIEIDGEFRLDSEGDVWFGGLLVPREIITAARAWYDEQRSTVEVKVKVQFSRGPGGETLANGHLVQTVRGVRYGVGESFPELAEAGCEWGRRNPG